MVEEAGSRSIIPSHRCHLCTLLNWNIKREPRRPNSLSIRLCKTTKQAFPFSMVGKSQWCQSAVWVSSTQGVLIKDGVDSCIERENADIQSGKILFATGDLRLDSSFPVIMCLCLLISHWGGYGIRGNQLHELGRALVCQIHTHTHAHTLLHQHTCDDLRYLHSYLSLILTPSLNASP